MDGATNLCSPSTTAKVNCLVMRCLHFGSVRGDLQEGYASPRLRFLIPLSPPLEHKNADFVLGRGQIQGKIAISDTKTSILCSEGRKMGVPKAKSAQKCRFCARETNAGLRETESEALGLLEVGLWACGF